MWLLKAVMLSSLSVLLSKTRPEAMMLLLLLFSVTVLVLRPSKMSASGLLAALSRLKLLLL